MPKFSIIIPIYNSACFLNKCFESIIHQTIDDYEVLLIDDGSIDDSLAICNQWKCKDSRFRVYHQENKGASTARNIGLYNAEGEYVQFLDSDDTLEPNCLETIFQLIKRYDNPDVIEFRLNYIGPNDITNVQGTILNDGVYDRKYLEKTFLPVMLQTQHDELVYYNIFNVLRVFRRDIIVKNSIKFNENIKRWEDWLFAMEIYNKANEMIVTSKALYNYYGHENGGLGGRYNPETYKYVIESYQSLDVLMGGKYNMFSDYAIQQKMNQLERCIREICEKESIINSKKILNEFINTEYFIKLIYSTQRIEGIYRVRQYIDSGNYKKAVNMLYTYILVTNSYRKKRMYFSFFYHKYIKGDYDL